jgi:autotransporter-associated beta strand protein
MIIHLWPSHALSANMAVYLPRFAKNPPHFLKIQPNKSMKTRRNIFLSPLIAIGLTQATHAASANWTGLGAGSDWATTGNWSASPVPGAGDVATFNGAGNGKTTITTAPGALTRYVFDTSSAAAYTISSGVTWSVPNGGGVTINSGVVNDQDLSGIQFIRPAGLTTTNFINNATGTTLRLGTIFNNNQAPTGNALLNFAPATGATIEVISGKLLDNASTAGRTVSVLVDGPGTFRMAGTGNFTGTDADGNSVTIRQGTLQASTINNAAGGRSSLGINGRIQFGQASTTNTATLDYYSAGNATTDRNFYIIDNNTAVFKVSGSASTNLTITSAITQSTSTNGGGKLTKDGVGTLTLDGTSSYTGATLVSAGTLLVNGALGNTVVSVDATATIGGTGSLGGNLTFAGTSKLQVVDFNDPLAVAGTVTFGSGFGIHSLLGIDWDSLALDTNYTLLSTSQTFTSADIANFGFDNRVAVGTGREAYFTSGSLAVVVIPEPSAVLLGGLGMLALLRRRR